MLDFLTVIAWAQGMCVKLSSSFTISTLFPLYIFYNKVAVGLFFLNVKYCHLGGGGGGLRVEA